MTKEEIWSLQVGSILQFRGVHGHPWTPQPVVEIEGRGVNVAGKHYVGFKQRFDDTANISGCVVEGRDDYVLVV